MPTILDKIVARKREEVAEAKLKNPATKLERRLPDCPPTLDFYAALASGDNVQLIAEVKKASPSAGVIRDDFDPVQIAQTYAAAGAACISVLTDEPFFQGALSYLTDIRGAVSVPLLRKDFIIDPYQLLEARVAGADCALLIAECLTAEELRRFVKYAGELGLQTLVEFYEPENLEAVLASETRLIGVNNRDLRTFAVDLQHTVRQRARIPEERIVIAESGIKTAADVQRLHRARVKAILVGESLMRQHDIGAAVQNLMGPAES